MSSTRSSSVKLSRVASISTGGEVKNSRSTSFRLSNFSSDISQVFKSISIRKNRQSVVLRPALQFQPSFQVKSKNPFNSLEVELLLKKIVERKTKEEAVCDKTKLKELAEDLSNEILSQVKMKNYDRYKIIVFVDVGEKFFQSFRYGLKCLWDIEKDSFTSYTFELYNLFIIATVFGVYYD